MHGNRRVYPTERKFKGFGNWMLLFLALAVFVSGLFDRNIPQLFSIDNAAPEKKLQLNEAFDETPDEMEIHLPAFTWYALQLGVFEDEDSASQLGDEYKLRGAAGYVWFDGRYRTLAAVYPIREDAQNVRKQLAENHMVQTHLYEIDFSPVQLRMRGMKGQLEILDAAFIHAVDLVTFLQKLSIQLDQQEMSVEEALQQMKKTADQMNLVAIRLNQRFIAPRPEVVAGLIGYMNQFCTFCQECTSVQSSVALGTKLKNVTLAALFELKGIYNLFTHT